MFIALMGTILFCGPASAVTITALDETGILQLVPTDTVGQGPADEPVIGNGVQGVGGIPFWADANGVPSDDDDPIIPGVAFDIILGPATNNDAHYNPRRSEPGVIPDIDALLITVTFDVSGGQLLLPITLAEGLDSATLGVGAFFDLSDLGFASGGGGMSFNPTDDDLVGAFLITGVDFNAGVHTDIGNYILTVPGWSDDYNYLYRIDLFGVDLNYEYSSPLGGGEIVSGSSNSAGGYLVPEPGSLMIIGGLVLGIAGKKRRTISKK
jgi:hypothetical protein